MNNDIWLYSFLPAIPALSCVVLLLKLNRNKAEWFSIRLFVNLLMMNVIQALAYIVFSFSLDIAKYIADAYLISAYFFFTHLLIYVSQLSENPPSIKNISKLYAFPFLMTSFHLAGLMVSDYRVENNALLHNDGPLAWCLDVYILSSCMFSVAFLLRNAKQARYKNTLLYSKNVLALISFIPLVIAFFVIVTLSMTQYAIPVVIIGPMVTLYTSFAFYYISKRRIIDASIGLRLLKSRVSLAWKLLETHKKNKESIKDLKNAIDKQFIKETLEENDHHIQKTADAMGLNHTTLRNKIKEFDL
jgi:hypothetical protein